MPSQWTLHYAQGVIMFLYELRESGYELHNIIKSLKINPLPDNARPIENRPNLYELHVLDHTIIYELREQQIVRILTVNSVKNDR